MIPASGKDWQRKAGLESEKLLFPLMLATIFASKLVLIAAFPGLSPYWDQWDSEAAFLYKPYFENTLGLQQLLSVHNEHRILFTRLLALTLLELRGMWDTQLQMIANSALQAISVGVLVALLWSGLGKRERVLVLVLTTVAMTLPLAWENTLAGFNSQWHFLSLFSLLAIKFAYRAVAFDRVWWGAMILALMSFLSSASGSLTFFLFAVLFTLQFLSGARSGMREVASIVIALLGFGVTFALVPHVAGHDPLKAQDLWQFVLATARVFSWPVPDVSTAFLLVNLPVIAFGLHAWKRRPARSDWQWLLLGLAGWTALQFVSLAYGRAIQPLASRYLETIVINVFINAAAGLWLLSAGRAGRLWGITASVATVWIAVIAFSLGSQAGLALEGASDRGRVSAVHARNVTSYLSSGNPKALEVPQGTWAHELIPYPSSDRLRMLLDDKAIRSILPTPLSPSFNQKAAAEHLMLGGVFSESVGALKRGLLSLGWPLYFGNFLLLILAALHIQLPLPRPAPSSREPDGHPLPPDRRLADLEQ